MTHMKRITMPGLIPLPKKTRKRFVAVSRGGSCKPSGISKSRHNDSGAGKNFD